jgi:UDP-galactopyranose mutase
MLDGIEVCLNEDYLRHRNEWRVLADKVLYTGMIDEYYDYCFGTLEYRSLRFEMEDLPIENYQGNAVVNYTEYGVPFTRIIEHKHFEFGCQGGPKTDHTVITREYPMPWKHGDDPYYPINDAKNNALFDRYKILSASDQGVIFGGRLGMFRYYDMHQVVAEALSCAEANIN